MDLIRWKNDLKHSSVEIMFLCHMKTFWNTVASKYPKIKTGDEYMYKNYFLDLPVKGTDVHASLPQWVPIP